MIRRRWKRPKPFLQDVTYVDDMNDVAEGCDALVIATEWPSSARAGEGAPTPLRSWGNLFLVWGGPPGFFIKKGR